MSCFFCQVKYRKKRYLKIYLDSPSEPSHALAKFQSPIHVIKVKLLEQHYLFVKIRDSSDVALIEVTLICLPLVGIAEHCLFDCIGLV